MLSVGIQRIHMSHNNRRHCHVLRKRNEKYHAKRNQTTVKSPVRMQV